MMQTNGLNIALIGCGFFGVQLASAFDKAQANLIAVTILLLHKNLQTNTAAKPFLVWKKCWLKPNLI
jgi:hypothetical protein